MAGVGAAAALGGRFVLGLLLLSAALPKLFASDDFARAVRNYRLLPSALADAVARWLPRVELGLACALLAGVETRAAATIVAGMLFVFVAAVAANLARGRSIDCGCSSSSSPRTIGWALVAEDVALLGIAILTARYAPSEISIPFINGASSSQLTNADGIGILIMAGTLVVGKLVASEAIRVHRASRRLEGSRA